MNGRLWWIWRRESVGEGNCPRLQTLMKRKWLGDFAMLACIQPILHSGAVFSVESSLFRPYICSSSVYKNSSSGCSSLKGTKYPFGSLSGRLVSSKPVPKNRAQKSMVLYRAINFSLSPVIRFSYRVDKFKALQTTRHVQKCIK